MFETEYRPSTNLELQDVLSRLRKRAVVDAVLLVGSGGEDKLTSYSDYDIVVVLAENPTRLFSMFTYISGRMADIYFFSAEELDELVAEADFIDANSIRGKLIDWVQTGRIVTDKSGRLQALKDKAARGNLTQVRDSQVYAAWFGGNFNLRQNRRLLESNDPVYLAALDMRLLFSVYDLLLYYFHARRVPWRGEKEAISYLQKSDSDFLELFLACTRESDRKKKFQLYEEVMKVAIAPAGGVWEEEGTAVTLEEDFSDEGIAAALAFWEGLIQ